MRIQLQTNTALLGLITIVFLLAILLPQTVLAANQDPCASIGWTGVWNKNATKWYCQYKRPATCPNGYRLSRSTRPPLKYRCLRANRASAASCPQRASFNPLSGQCIGSFGMACPSGYRHTEKVFLRTNGGNIGTQKNFYCAKDNGQFLLCGFEGQNKPDVSYQRTTNGTDECKVISFPPRSRPSISNYRPVCYQSRSSGIRVSRSTVGVKGRDADFCADIRPATIP